MVRYLVSYSLGPGSPFLTRDESVDAGGIGSGFFGADVETFEISIAESGLGCEEVCFETGFGAYAAVLAGV